MTIKENTTKTAKGFIFVKNAWLYSTLSLTITNGIFSDNTNEIGLGGIYIETTGFEVEMTLYVDGVTV